MGLKQIRHSRKKTNKFEDRATETMKNKSEQKMKMEKNRASVMEGA